MARNAGALPARQRRRALIALIMAPVTTAALLTLIFGTIANMTTQTLELPNVARAAGILVLFGLALSLVLIWPFHAVAFRLRWRNVTTYVGAGAILGLVATGVVFAMMFNLTRSIQTDATMIWSSVLGYGVLFGIPTTFMTWLFWFIRRPDRDRDGDPISVFE